MKTIDNNEVWIEPTAQDRLLAIRVYLRDNEFNADSLETLLDLAGANELDEDAE